MVNFLFLFHNWRRREYVLTGEKGRFTPPTFISGHYMSIPPFPRNTFHLRVQNEFVVKWFDFLKEGVVVA